MLARAGRRFDGGPGGGRAAFEVIARDVGVELGAIEPAEVYGDAEDPPDLVVERGSETIPSFGLSGACQRERGCSTVTSFQGEHQFLHTFDAANASREIRTEQTANRQLRLQAVAPRPAPG